MRIRKNDTSFSTEIEVVMIRLTRPFYLKIYSQFQLKILTYYSRVFGAYTMDVIASTMFGLDIDSQNGPDNPFVRHAKSAFNVGLSNPFLILGSE